MVPDDLLKSLLGLTEEAALDILKPTDYKMQIVSNDGESYMTDMMMDDNRVKVEIEKGFIVKALVG